MSLRVIARNVGMALLVSALFMLLSIVVSISRGNDSALAALLISFTLTFIVGIFPFIFIRKTPRISLKEGYLIITLSWLLSFVFGMLPYALYGEPFTLANAWFESVSGFTTTGATILGDIEALPESLLFWRSSTHFIGGLGVVVFLLLIIPDSSPVRFRLTNMELSSLSREGYKSQSRKTIYIFAYVYLGLCAAAFFAYLLAGMSPFDAINHAMSVCATGGFSTRNLSIGAYNSVAIDIITMVFMLLASVHFGLIYLSAVTRSLKPLFKNPIFRYYVNCLLLFAVIISIALKVEGHCSEWGESFLKGSFNVLSYASTTGFALGDNSRWGMLPSALLIFASLVCGCAGSTTGGLKIDRLYVLKKAIRRQILKILHPSSVIEIKMGKTILHDEEVYPHILYLSVYSLFMILSVAVCILFGPDSATAFTGSIASLGNVGPSIWELGSLCNYDAQPLIMKFIFTLDMFLGRVEIYPVVAVAAMLFDVRFKRRRR